METPTPHEAVFELDPEYVGAYTEPLWDTCAHVEGDLAEELEYCDAEATHTVVFCEPSGELYEIPMCDDHGEPEDAEGQ